MAIWQEHNSVAEFPLAHDRRRVAQIAENRQLWQADHEAIFTRIEGNLDANEIEALRRKFAALNWTTVNLLGYLSQDTAEHLSLSPADIKPENDSNAELIEDIRKRSKWDVLQLDETEQCSAVGEMCVKLHLEDDGPVISSVDPDFVFRGEDYFDEYARLNNDSRITKFPFVAIPVRMGDDWYVVLEIHEPGVVLYRAYHWDVDGRNTDSRTFADKGKLSPAAIKPSELLGVEDYETGIDEPTLLIIRNEVDPRDRRRGKSDYTTDLVDLQKEFEEKLSELLRHFDELVNGGIVVLPMEAQSLIIPRGPKQSKQGRAQDFGRNPSSGNDLPTIDAKELSCIFEDGQNAGVTKYVARQAEYEGGLKALQMLISCFERVGRISLDHLLEQSKAPESGRAMRLARTKDRKRIERKQRRYEREFAHVYELALRMVGVDDAVSFEFPDPFPLSDEERAEIAEKLVQQPVMSVETALRKLFNMSPEDALAEIAKLKEARDAAGMGEGLFGNRPASNNDFDDDNEDE